MTPSTTAAVMGGTGIATAVAPKAPRWYTGQMCGVHVAGLPPVNGGAADDSLVLSWFYPRYAQDADRARIRATWAARGYRDVLCSWQDDAAVGLSYEQIIESRQELCAAGFRPCEWLSSKVYSPANDAAGTLALMRPMLDRFLEADCISRYCVGGELNLWNTYGSLQAITDAIAPAIVAKGRPLYVHFSTNYADWRPDHPGSTFADYWNPNVGKLTGLWFQSDPYATNHDLQEAIRPILERFAGYYGVAPDSGFGHPFDLIGLEISAQAQFNGEYDEAEGDRRGTVVLQTPAVTGPGGTVQVHGSGNGSLG